MPPLQVRTYALPPTPLIPNSPHHLIHYPGLLLPLLSRPDFSPAHLYDLYRSNGWESQWVSRYGPTQLAHYHSAAHECMTVLSGQGATLRFGVADLPSPEGDDDDDDAHTHGGAHEHGAVYVEAQRGDVFILPAGVAHKTFDPRPEPKEPAFFQCKDEEGRVVRDEGRARAFFEGVEVGEAFQMMGSYPVGGEWDFAVGGEHEGREGEVWSVPVPERDPVLGLDERGLVGLWKGKTGMGGSRL